jgi:hypothetical protein
LAKLAIKFCGNIFFFIAQRVKLIIGEKSHEMGEKELTKKEQRMGRAGTKIFAVNVDFFK